MGVPILVLIAFVLVFSVFGMLVLLLRLTNVERVQRGDRIEVRKDLIQVVWVPRRVKMQDLSLGANRTRRSPMDQKVGKAKRKSRCKSNRPRLRQLPGEKEQIRYRQLIY